jgi:predicted Fe-S protein YdhL (DUF1289 family)
MSAAQTPKERTACATSATCVNPVASPCINVCKMNARNGLCTGCLRTIDEIAAWSKASNDERRCILATVERRRAEHA